MDTTDEKYPLLLLGSEEGGRKQEFKKKNRFSDTVRNKNILQGATTIITQWPGRWTACWATSLCFGILLIFMTVLISFAMEDFHKHHSITKCSTVAPKRFTNKTVHVVHDGGVWKDDELEILQFIINVYKDYTIHVSIFQKNQTVGKRDLTSRTEETKPETVATLATDKKRDEENSLLLYDGPLQSFDAFSFFEKLRNMRPLKRKSREVKGEENTSNPSKTFESLTTGPNVFVDHFIYEEYFQGTPLRSSWKKLDPDMLIFACRVQELWQHSGISFLIPQTSQINSSSNSSISNSTSQEVALKSLILTSKSVFEHLPVELVSIDRKSFHIGSKTPCHAFFGELLSKLSSNLHPPTIQKLIEKMLQEFCKRGAVNSQDCKLI